MSCTFQDEQEFARRIGRQIGMAGAKVEKP